MKSGIVKASDLMAANRMDAGYHLTAQRLAQRVSELQEVMTASQALVRLAEVPLNTKLPLMPIARGGRFSGDVIERTEREYPHLSIAILEEAREKLVSDARDRISHEERAIASLQTIATQPPTDRKQEFRAGYAYPLLDQERYVDDYDPEGRFRFAYISRNAKPAGMLMHDAWIVDEHGAIHPGYDACGVPVRIEDVDLQSGKPMDVREP